MSCQLILPASVPCGLASVLMWPLTRAAANIPPSPSPLHCLSQAVVRTLQETTTAVANMSSSSSSRTTRSTEEAAPELEEEVSSEWLESLHVRKKELQEKRQSRQLKRQEMSQRRSAASHKRMMIISQLADNTVSRECCKGGGSLICDLRRGSALMAVLCSLINLMANLCESSRLPSL